MPLEVTLCRLEPTECSSTDYKITSASAGGEFTFVSVIRNPCQPGYRGVPPFGRPGPDGQCTPCPPGSFTASWGRSECSLCPEGTQAQGFNNTACTPCPQGTYSDEPGLGTCKPCPGNTLMLGNGSVTVDRCLPLCTEGSYSQDNVLFGQSIEPCVPCPAGSFSPLKGMLSCQLCPKGTFSQGGAGQCTPCGGNESTRYEASAAPEDCSPMCLPGQSGRYGVDDCADCPRGKYSPGYGATECLECGANQTTRGSGDVACFPTCGPGEIGERGVGPVCTRCEAGQVRFCTRLPCCYFSDGASSSLPLVCNL